jgi:hypothetical protein
MDPFVRHELRNSWGFCQRHTVAWLIVESAFYHDYLHGPSILMSDLIERAKHCFPKHRMPLVPLLVAMNLRNKKPCHMCSMGYTLNSTGGFADREILARGRNTQYIIDFASETAIYWRQFVCPVCANTFNKEGILCRPHLLREFSHNNYSYFITERDFISYLSGQIEFFSRSFRWEYHGTATAECKSALITAAGWLNGWTELINFVNSGG